MCIRDRNEEELLAAIGSKAIVLGEADKNELVKVDNPVNCNPRKKLPKQLKEMLDKLLFND